MTAKTRYIIPLILLALATTARAATILVDLGPDNLNDGVNVNIPNANGISTNTALNDYFLVDTDDNVTGIKIDISGWDGSASNINASGSFTGDAAIFNSTANSLFQQNDAAPTLTMTGLTPTSTYDLVLFSSKFDSGDRESVFSIAAGNGSSDLSLNAAYNLSNVVNATGLTPDINNEIVITVTKGPTTSRYFYFSAMQITETIPEPSSIALLGLSGLAAVLMLRRRR